MAPSSRVSHDSEYVCKLKRALYGLKQAPRTWFEKFSIVISSFRFVSCNNDSVFLLSALMQVVSFYLYILMTLMIFQF
jgi:hypothetical protein